MSEPARYSADDDDGPSVSVPSRILALCLETQPCEHRPDAVCADCMTDALNILRNILYPIHVEVSGE